MSPHFDLEEIDGITIVKLVGPKLAPDASRPLYDLVEGGGHRRLLLDLNDVRFLSSNALGILVNLKKKCDAAGGRLRLCGLGPDLINLLQLTRLDRILEMDEGREEALKGF